MSGEPSIKFGIDGCGRKVTAREALKGRTYKCYYCKEDIHVRGYKKPYFAHMPIHNRTPQQMVCEGYKGKGIFENYIKNESDKLYIFNGGVPVHLVEFEREKYELVAMFPPLSNLSLEKLKEWEVKIRITGDGRDQIFSAWNLRRYKIKTEKNWIYVKGENIKYEIEEIKRKWLWGIRGIAFDEDLFRMDVSGGIRVAQMSNIVVGKEYLFVHKGKNLNNLPGLNFNKKGIITFSQGKKYDVYSVVVTNITDESIKYIQKNGYNLIEKSDELIPMWPPAAIEGKELIYHNGDNIAYLYHKKETNQQIFQWNSEIPYQIKERDNIIKCSSNNNVILISDYEFNSLAKEMRYLLTHERQNFFRKRVFQISICYRADNDIVKNLCDLFKQKKYNNVIFESNYEVVIFHVDNMYVTKSSCKHIYNLLNSGDIWIFYMPFGYEKVTCPILSKEIELIQDKKDLLFDSIQKLYQCGSSYIPENGILNKWILYAENRNEKDLLKILLAWRNIGYMPDKAILLLNELEEN